MHCNHCQEQLLHYLYDALDAEERALIAAHLDECPACRAAIEGLRLQQELLAEAAKESFAEVAFQPPTDTPKRFAEPTQMLPRRRQRGFSWVRVAAAASIVLFVFGGGTIGVIGWIRSKDQIQVAETKAKDAKRQSEEFTQSVQKRQVQTQEEIRKIQEEINRLFADWGRDATKKRSEQQEKLSLRVEAPKSAPAGGTIPVQVNMPNFEQLQNAAKNAKAPEPVYTGKLEVRDGNNRAIYQQNIRNLQANNTVNIPPQELMPGQNYRIETVVLDKAGNVRAREEFDLSTPEYLTHLMTDRPMYRPGESVHFRSLTLERFSLKPAQENLQLVYRVLGPNQQEVYKLEGTATLVTDQNKEPINGPDGKPLRGLGAGDFQIPPELPGGQYTITVSESQNRFPPEKRSFLVSQWQMPRMNKELKFHRSSYGPGEAVEVEATAKRAEGGAPLAGNSANITAQVDGRVVYKNTLRTDAAGTVRFPFPLPPSAAMPNGIGTVSVEFNDGAGPETIVRPIPIVLNKIHVEFFPEGGDLVEGVANRVYFQAKNTIGRPAELKGRIVDQQGNTAATLETLHDDLEEGINQGQGAFTFTPAAGKRYQLKIDAPIGATSSDPFPATKAEGVVLHLTKPVADGAIEGEVTSTDRRRLLMVGAYCRGRLLEQERLVAFPGKAIPFTLRTDPSVGGVYRVTVYEIVKVGDDTQFLPRAERLTYRPTEQRLNVALDGVKNEYFPGEQLKFRVKAQDEKKQKAPAVALVSVVDLSLIKLVDDKTDRTLPTHFLLTSEIRKPEDFENADVLLGKHPKAATALDLLLGTQGWRRFAEQDPQRFQRQQPPREVVRVAGVGNWNFEGGAAQDVVTDKVDKAYAGKAVKMLEQLAEREAVENGPPEAPRQQQALQAGAQFAEQELAGARASLREYELRLMQYLLGALVIAALLMGLGAIGLGIRRLGQGRSALASLVTGTALLLFLFMGSLAGVFYMIGSKGDPLVAFNQPREMAVKDQDVANAAVKAAPDMAVAEAKDAMPQPKAAPGGAGDAPAPVPPPPAAPMMVQDGAANGDKAKVAMPVEREGNADPKTNDRLAQVAKKRGAAPVNRMQAPMAAPGGAVMPQANQMQFGGGGFGGPANAGLDQDARGQEGFAGGMPFGGPMQNGMGARAANFANERQLRSQKDYGTILMQRTGRRIEVPTALPPLVVREYAHQYQPSKDDVRRDFTETVFWQPALVLPGGEAQIAFDLSDSVTRYQVTVFSHSLDGRLGADTFELAARLPYSIDPKVPFEVSNTDKMVIPVAVKNDTDNEVRVELSANATGLKTQDPPKREVHLAGKDRSRGFFSYEPAVVSGEALLRVKGNFMSTVNGTDTVERSFKIVPDGFPIRGSASGLLEKVAVHDITLPADWLAGTLQCQVQVFPSTLAELQKGLDGLLREPCGCFEQSSSSNYPNVLILNYLQEAGQGDPNVEKRARGLLQSGYQKLTSFECIDPTPPSPPSQGGAERVSPPSQGGAGGGARRGYEWFGQTAPPHEALTAYGLLQFRDMAKVYAVDPAMVERTKKYLLAQRDGEGGFKRNARALDSFGRAPDHITSAYILWALTDSGVEEDLTKEMTALGAKAKDSNDPYFVALVTLGQLSRGKADDALALAKKLKDAQKDDGHLEGAQTSITGSQGRDLHLETTALAVLAWLKANRPDEFHGNVQKAVKWISSQRSGQGSFGATQSTILALKALIAHTRDSKKIAEDGKLTVTLPGQKDTPVAEASFTAGAAEPITLTLPEGKGLKPGKNKVVLEITGKNTFPYTLSWSYQTLTPPSDAGCPVKLTAKLNKPAAQEGDTVKFNATVENVTDQGRGMTVAIIGLPAGLALPEDAKQLKELAKLRDNGSKPGTISTWELRGRDLVLYWRDLAPKAKINVELDLICRLPGTYRGPASRAYLYYNSDRKDWIEPLAITIEPQRAE